MAVDLKGTRNQVNKEHGKNKREIGGKCVICTSVVCMRPKKRQDKPSPAENAKKLLLRVEKEDEGTPSLGCGSRSACSRNCCL